MPESHERWQGKVALSAVGALPPDEAEALQSHLAECPQCRVELEELHAVAADFSRAESDVSGEDSPPPPPALGDRVVWLVAKARRSERLRRRAVAGIAAAAACVALVGIGMAVPGPAGPPQEPLALDAPQGVEADAELVAHTWGTEVKFVIEGLADGERYEVTFLTHAGERISAGTFIGVSDRPIVCDMNAAVLRDDASRMEVATPEGDVVIAADLS